MNFDTSRVSRGFDLGSAAPPVPATAIVELVANAWDAWATKVEIAWPERGTDTAFVIEDNGKGMTEAQFQTRWKALDYNRQREEGTESAPPPELAELRPRPAYGRNGKGREANRRMTVFRNLVPKAAYWQPAQVMPVGRTWID